MAVATGKSFASRFGVHIAVLIFVAIWTVPTLATRTGEVHLRTP